jgi:D-glycero-beta-D-manno-heptose 1-phosphate adenylyltransferase
MSIPASSLYKIEQWKRQGKKIVFTNGCFDILHAGHVDYLSEAAALGDVLIIGLNSDESVKRLKGASRPVISESDRKKLLESLRFVDDVIIFDEDTPLLLIGAVMPDILVKGGDWAIDKIIGAEGVMAHGGEVKSLGFTPGISTTAIIERIKGLP